MPISNNQIEMDISLPEQVEMYQWLSFSNTTECIEGYYGYQDGNEGQIEIVVDHNQLIEEIERNENSIIDIVLSFDVAGSITPFYVYTSSGMFVCDEASCVNGKIALPIKDIYEQTGCIDVMIFTSGSASQSTTLSINSSQFEIIVDHSLTSLSILKKPTKTHYLEGEAFNRLGLLLQASYTDGTSEEVNDFTITCNTPLTSSSSVIASIGPHSCVVPIEIHSASSVSNSGKPFSDIGQAAKVNLLTGRVLIINDLVSIGANSYSINLQFVYDSNMQPIQKSLFWGYGNGVKLSIDLRIINTGNNTLTLIDEIGYAHDYIKYDTINDMYYDYEDARNTIQITQNGYEFVDGEGNSIIFDGEGRSEVFISNINPLIRKRVLRNQHGQASVIYDERCDNGRVKRECVILDYDPSGMLINVRAEMNGSETIRSVQLNYDSNGNLISEHFFSNVNGVLEQAQTIVSIFEGPLLTKMYSTITKEAIEFEYQNDKAVRFSTGFLLEEQDEIHADERISVDYNYITDMKTRTTNIRGLITEYQFDAEERLSSTFEIDTSGMLRAFNKPQGEKMTVPHSPESGISVTSDSLNGELVYQSQSLGIEIPFSFVDFPPSYAQDFLMSMYIMIDEPCGTFPYIEAIYGQQVSRIGINGQASNVWQMVQIPLSFATGNQKLPANSITLRLMSDNGTCHRFRFGVPFMAFSDIGNLCIEVNSERIVESKNLYIFNNGIRATHTNGGSSSPRMSEQDILYAIMHRRDIPRRGLVTENCRTRVSNVSGLFATSNINTSNNLLSEDWGLTSVFVEIRGRKLRNGNLRRENIRPTQTPNFSTIIDNTRYSLNVSGNIVDELNKEYDIFDERGIVVEDGTQDYSKVYTYSPFGILISTTIRHNGDQWVTTQVETDEHGENIIAAFTLGKGSNVFQYSRGLLIEIRKAEMINGDFIPSGTSTRFEYDTLERIRNVAFEQNGVQAFSNSITHGNNGITSFHSSHCNHVISINRDESSMISSFGYEENSAPYMSVSESHSVIYTTYWYGAEYFESFERSFDIYGKMLNEMKGGERKTKIWHNNENNYSNAISKIGKIEDKYIGVDWDFTYDSYDMMVEERMSGENYENLSITHDYERWEESYNLFGGIKTTIDENDGRIIRVEIRDLNGPVDVILYSYDWMGRVTTKTGVAGFTAEYVGTSPSPSRITRFGGGTSSTQSIQYDNESRATNVTIDGNSTSYTYDGLGRLCEESTNGLSISYRYEGDRLSHIESGITKKSFSYDSQGKLTSLVYKLNNTPVAVNTYNYDNMGNLISVTKDGITKSASWSRRLLTMFDNIEFKYDCNGRRTKKGNTKFYYSSLGKLLIQESETGFIHFVYDGEGLCGFIDTRLRHYWYIKNWRGDVIAIATENEIVARYSYDAWGNCKVLNPDGTTNTSSSFVGNINPIRYGSYYYDVETSLYWLSSRYYDPEIGRFISPDSVDYLDPT
ncbi:MAG: hypothetical protein MJ220_02425, partial [Bacilli bacterium]|nr:hypothetical protein [Bacilli bacterium]